MKNQLSTKLEIDDISKINIHHQYDTHIPVCNITQLDTGVISIGLYNGSIVFFAPTNLDEPYLCFQVDKFPIYSIVQIEDDQLIIASGKIYIIYLIPKGIPILKKKKK